MGQRQADRLRSDNEDRFVKRNIAYQQMERDKQDRDHQLNQR